jgi:hypothetical protein
MDEIAFVVRPHPYQHDVRSPNLLEPLIQPFLMSGDSAGLMGEVNARCNVPIKRLYS